MCSRLTRSTRPRPTTTKSPTRRSRSSTRVSWPPSRSRTHTRRVAQTLHSASRSGWRQRFGTFEGVPSSAVCSSGRHRLSSPRSRLSAPSRRAYRRRPTRQLSRGSRLSCRRGLCGSADEPKPPPPPLPRHAEAAQARAPHRRARAREGRLREGHSRAARAPRLVRGLRRSWAARAPREIRRAPQPPAESASGGCRRMDMGMVVVTWYLGGGPGHERGAVARVQGVARSRSIWGRRGDIGPGPLDRLSGT